MALGAGAEQACAVVVAGAPHVAYRQLTMIDAAGRTACFSGGRVLGCHGSAAGIDVVSAGNLLANEGVPQAIVGAFEASAGLDLGARVLAAMQAGLDAGGEAGPIHSAGMKLVDQVPWPIADLRVDWSDAPMAELAKLWTVFEPQMDAYVTRALNPGDR
jgi:uncharacterized Ntn-hydrolase superfamily protein